MDGEPQAASALLPVQMPCDDAAAGRLRTPDDELHLLRAAVEGGLDGMVVVSTDGRMITFNRRFQEIWPIPDDVVATGSDDAALASVLDKLVDPEGFLARVRELYERADGSARDELHLRDGRVLDRFGTALRDDDGTYIGWAWYFRDVSAERAAAEDARRLGALVAVAQSLGDARDEDEVLAAVAGPGAAVLQAQGVALCVPGEPGRLRVLTTPYFGEEVQAEVADLPEDAPLPIAHCARAHETMFLTDRTDAVERFPDAAGLYELARTRGSAFVPLLAGGGSVGALAVGYADAHPWRAADRDLLLALSALTAQTLERLRAHEAEQRAVSRVRRLAESLQRSLLTPPPPSDLLQVAVRYQPAAQEAQVGGDWYDAFTLRDGRTTLVVGDVAGHDSSAAAAMAQVRNVLRGVAQTHDGPPSAVLCALDAALAQLEVGTLATAVLCHVSTSALGVHLRWSNAGHPPPLLLLADGTAQALTRDPELLLGISPEAPRDDHDLALPVGATVVLYTDGLVERRGLSLDEALAGLAETAAGIADLPPEELADALLTRLATGAEDDVALLVLRVGGAA